VRDEKQRRRRRSTVRRPDQDAAHSFLLGGFPCYCERSKPALYCLFNFSAGRQLVTWFLFKEHGTVLRHLLITGEQEYSVATSDFGAGLAGCCPRRASRRGNAQPPLEDQALH
jgi:hypothetical protein